MFNLFDLLSRNAIDFVRWFRWSSGSSSWVCVYVREIRESEPKSCHSGQTKKIDSSPHSSFPSHIYGHRFPDQLLTSQLHPSLFLKTQTIKRDQVVGGDYKRLNVHDFWTWKRLDQKKTKKFKLHVRYGVCSRLCVACAGNQLKEVEGWKMRSVERGIGGSGPKGVYLKVDV